MICLLRASEKWQAKSVFTVVHIVLDVWVEASFDIFLATVFFAFAFFDRKVLVSTKVLYHIELNLKFFILEEFFIVRFFVHFFY